MSNLGLIQIIFFYLVLILLTKPVGSYIFDIIEDGQFEKYKFLNKVEKIIRKILKIDFDCSMNWFEYSKNIIIFSLVSCVATYLILIGQSYLPFNPCHFGSANSLANSTALTPDLAFNTAISFATNTNWQNYSGEMTMSYLSQMLGLAVQNFLSAAVGIACAVVLARGIANNKTENLGNVWKDLFRITIFVLLPFAFVLALLLVSQGVIQNFNSYVISYGLDNFSQLIPMGPVASQEAIKMIGTNGGGFFNANSAHPFENPTPFSNFLEMMAIFIIPAGLTFTFGKMVKDIRQGIVLFIVMLIISLAGTIIAFNYESAGNPNFNLYRVNYNTANLGDHGGNMEGKEMRFGISNSSLFANVTTQTSCGAVNSTHDSFMPLSGLILTLNMALGEVVFGGTGSGLYGILVFAIITIFVAGLMVGRTPEYLGKKIEKQEIKLAMLYILVSAFCILGFSALVCVLNFKTGSYLNPLGSLTNNLNNSGPHGFSEFLYAITSCTANNGSAFAGISCNSPFFNMLLGIIMFIGRYLTMVPVFAIAGHLSQKKLVPISSGTFPTDNYLFVLLLIFVILIVGALTFLPALCLGPIIEYFLVNCQRLF